MLLSFIFLFSIKNFSKLESEILQKEEEFTKVTTQVVHDIRSPIVALDVLLENLESIEERKRVALQRAIHRINDIANNLLLRAKDSASQHFVSHLKLNNKKPESIFLILDNIVAESDTNTANHLSLFSLILLKILIIASLHWLWHRLKERYPI